MKLDFDLSTFEANVARMRREDRAMLRQTLISGASAYATTAARYTPPGIGNNALDPVFYADGVMYDRSSNATARGRRRVYDLLQLARNPDTGHYRKLYGTLLRQGYYYAVSIKREGKRTRLIPCRTEAEAAAYAHETYRGLSRAAWGLSIGALTGKVPPVFRKFVSRRPQLSRMSALNRVSFDEPRGEVLITNEVLKTGADYLAVIDSRASFQALRVMNDRMNKHFKDSKQKL